MILAELDLVLSDFRSENSRPMLGDASPSSSSPHHHRPAWYSAKTLLPTSSSIRALLVRLTEPTSLRFRLFHLALFIFGMYLMSCPFFYAETNPGYTALITLLTPSWFHGQFQSYSLWTIGSCCLLTSAAHSRDIRPLYTNRFSQYAGRISYALYFVQGPVLHLACYGMLPVWQNLTLPLGARATQLGFATQWTLGALLSWPLTVYFADLLWRALDVPSVRFARWCEEWFEDRRWKAAR